jgi:hypothetical protein
MERPIKGYKMSKLSAAQVKRNGWSLSHVDFARNDLIARFIVKMSAKRAARRGQLQRASVR